MVQYTYNTEPGLFLIITSAASYHFYFISHFFLPSINSVFFLFSPILVWQCEWHTGRVQGQVILDRQQQQNITDIDNKTMMEIYVCLHSQCKKVVDIIIIVIIIITTYES